MKANGKPENGGGNAIPVMICGLKCSVHKNRKTPAQDGAKLYKSGPKNYICANSLNRGRRGRGRHGPVIHPGAVCARCIRERHAINGADAIVRKKALEKACRSAGCRDTKSSDMFRSCSNCVAFVAVPVDEQCNFPQCMTGKFPNDYFCAWHMRNFYITGVAACRMCEQHTAVDRFCDSCKMRCRYVCAFTGLGFCPAMRTSRSIFCTHHQSTLRADDK